MIRARFVHTNLVAQDWRRLAQFYEEVFGCEVVPPERDLSGRWLEEGTGVLGAEIRGVHLRLPGWGAEGPTLEVFQYNQCAERKIPAVNRPGLAHIAFAVGDVVVAQQAVLAAGGGSVGKVVSVPVPGAGTVTFAYVSDPEGNIIELQRWSSAPNAPQAGAATDANVDAHSHGVWVGGNSGYIRRSESVK